MKSGNLSEEGKSLYSEGKEIFVKSGNFSEEGKS